MTSRNAPDMPRQDPDRTIRGASAVEMALVLPVLLLMFFGIIEIANILRIQVSLQSTVTSIAHDAAMHQTTQASAEQYMGANELASVIKQSTFDDAADPVLTLTPPETTSCKQTPCTPFEVRLTYRYMAMLDLMKPFFDNLELSATARKVSEPW